MLRCFSKHIIYLLSFLLLLTSCAQQVQPSGGAFDRSAPKLAESHPTNGSIHFQSKEIYLRFNEFIQLTDIQNQLIISPPLEQQPDILQKNKELKLKFKEALKSNTTYCLNFGGSITDITENNKLEDFKYVFSTGNVIDSLRLTGTVENAELRTTEKGILVMLYDSLYDSIPAKKLPTYFARTNADGSFMITNIKQGIYKVFALKDGNANYLYDQPSELVAFQEQTIDMQKDTSVDLRLFNGEIKKQYIKSVNNVEWGKIEIILNTSAQKVELNPIEGSKINYEKMYRSTTNDTLTLWYKNSTIDTLKAIVVVNEEVLDTIEIAYKKIDQSKKITKNARGAFKLWVNSNIFEKELDYGKSLFFKTNHPIDSINNAYIKLENITDSLRPTTIDLTKTLLQKDDFTLNNNTQLPFGKYAIELLPGAFTDIYGLTNDTINVKLNIKDKENYGSIKLNILFQQSNINYIVHLINDAGKVVAQRLVTKEFITKEKYNTVFENLLPGNYQVKLVYDTDLNKKWTTGDYYKKRQPEEIIVFSGVIAVKANWDIDQEWKLSK